MSLDEGNAMFSKEELMAFLTAGGEARERLFAAAREARRRAFGNRIFLYGFLYLSTHCRNDCTFCQKQYGDRPVQEASGRNA